MRLFPVTTLTKKCWVFPALILAAAQLSCNLFNTQPTGLPPAVPAATVQAAATATGPATTADAKALLALAVQHYDSVGREQALADFNVQKPPFVDRGLYLVCLGEDHKMTANGAYPLLVGVDADAITDAKGQPLGELVWQQAALQPQGQLNYHWVNPLTGQDESKVLYYQTLGDDVCGVAADSP